MAWYYEDLGAVNEENYGIPSDLTDVFESDITAAKSD